MENRIYMKMAEQMKSQPLTNKEKQFLENVSKNVEKQNGTLLSRQVIGLAIAVFDELETIKQDIKQGNLPPMYMSPL